MRQSWVVNIRHTYIYFWKELRHSTGYHINHKNISSYNHFKNTNGKNYDFNSKWIIINNLCQLLLKKGFEIIHLPSRKLYIIVRSQYSTKKNDEGYNHLTEKAFFILYFFLTYQYIKLQPQLFIFLYFMKQQ